jgi:hypothetical protein
VSSDALEAVRKMVESGTFNTDFFNFESRGMVSGRKKRGRKLKKLARKGIAKLTKAVADSTFKVMRTLVFNASETYKKALNAEEQKQRVRILSPPQKQEVVLEKVLGPDDDDPGYIHAASMKGARNIGLLAFGRTKLADSDLFLSYDRTILAIAATLGKMVTTRSGAYTPITDGYVRNNLVKFLVSAQRDVAGESGHDVRDETSSLVPVAVSSSISLAKLDDEEHDALVESMIALRDYISDQEITSGRRTPDSSPWNFVVLIPSKSAIGTEDAREDTYDQIHQYVLEEGRRGQWQTLPDPYGERTSAKHDTKTSRFVLGVNQSTRVSEAFVPSGSEGKLKRWKDRKNVCVQVRRSL